MTTGRILRASTAADGTPANGGSLAVHYNVSRDGRYVAFESEADNLVPDDTNGSWDTFVKDMKTGAIVIENGSLEKWGIYDSNLSTDGRYRAFGSRDSNLVPNDTNGEADIFVEDLQTGTIVRASTDADGTQANNGSFGIANYNLSISADGRYVLFWSQATNLVPDDTNGGWDYFVKDLETGAIVRASTASDGSQANFGAGEWGDLSADGRYVTFVSGSVNLVPDDTNGKNDIFVKDLKTGTIVRANTAADGTQANDYSFGDASLSADGRTVVFSSAATNLVPDDTGGIFDIFVKDVSEAFFSGVSLVGTPGDDELQGTVDDDVIRGLGGDDILEGLAGNDELYGDGGTEGDDACVEVSFVSEDAGYQSTYGWYDSETLEASILVANVDTATNPGLDGFAAGLPLAPDDLENLGFFLIPDGYNENADPGEPFANGDGTDLDLEVFQDGGVWKVRDTDSGYVFEGRFNPAYFTDPALNPGGLDHVMEEGDLAADGSVTHKWEDLPSWGDMDFDDVVFQVETDYIVEVSFAGEDAGYQSTYGWYHTGTGEAEIVVANVETDTNPDLSDFSATLSLTADEIGHLGFFLIPDGYNQNGDPGEPLADGDGTDLDLEVVETNGVWQVRDMSTGRLFEGLGAPAYFTEADKNPAGNDHVMEEGDLMADGTVTHNWEDLPGLGDQDFDDVVFEVNFDCGPAAPGVPGDDSLTGGAGNDIYTGGSGMDSFRFNGTDFDRDTITDFALAEDTLIFESVNNADDPDDLTYAVGDFDADGAQDDIRITFAGLGDDLADDRIDVLDVGAEVEALKADMLFV